MTTLPLLAALACLLTGAVTWLVTAPPPEAAAPAVAPGAGTTERFRRLLARQQIRVPDLRAFVLQSLGLGLGLATVAQILLAVPLLTLAAGVAGSLARGLFYRLRDAGQAQARRTALAEVLLQLRLALNTGSGLDQAFRLVAGQAPPILRPTLGHVTAVMSARGFPAAMEDWRATADDPAVALVTEACTLAHAAGSLAVPDVLEEALLSLQDRLDLAELHQAEQRETRLQARAGVLIGLGFLVVPALFDPNRRAFYQSPLGGATIAVVLGLLALGYVLMGRLGRLRQDAA